MEDRSDNAGDCVTDDKDQNDINTSLENDSGGRGRGKDAEIEEEDGSLRQTDCHLVQDLDGKEGLRYIIS